ncbi:MAG: homocysteine S-methyltransferase family protein [Deltaproteobacteria bacterium]
MNTFLKSLEDKVLIFDGSKGAVLQKLGLEPGSCPESWNLYNSEKVKDIYQSYIQAGADVIQTNTFGANRAILERYNLAEKVDEINSASIKLAKEAAGNKAYVAVSIGPTGKLLEPSGDLSFEEAYDIFKEQIIAAAQSGADILNFETFTDLAEMRCAILASKENSNLPIIASMSFEANGYTMMGNTAASFAISCQSLGVDMLGVNCSTGPAEMVKIIQELKKFSNLPISAKPNAGIPEFINGKSVYTETPDNFRRYVKEFVDKGASLIGGCCGTTPEHISAIREELDKIIKSCDIKKTPVKPSYISSSSKYIPVDMLKNVKAVPFVDSSNSESFVSSSFIDSAADRVMDIMSEDYDLIYLSLDSISKQEYLAQAVKTIQTYVKLPLIIHSNSVKCIEKALRIYNGRAGIAVKDANDSTFEIINLAHKYGCAITNHFPKLETTPLF